MVQGRRIRLANTLTGLYNEQQVQQMDERLSLRVFLCCSVSVFFVLRSAEGTYSFSSIRPALSPRLVDILLCLQVARQTIALVGLHES